MSTLWWGVPHPTNFSNTMIETKVEGSHLNKIVYNDDHSLIVEFANGHYLWSNVEESDHAALLSAESKGSFLHKTIEAKYGKGQKLSIHKTTDDRVGYLIESVQVVTNNPIKPNTPEAHCPACQTEAQGFTPPMADQRYVDRIQQEKELNNLETNEEAHKSFLKVSGGYIETCTKCTTSYFVPARLAKIKAS